MKHDLVAVFVGLVFIICLAATMNIVTSEQHFQKIVETCKESK